MPDLASAIARAYAARMPTVSAPFRQGPSLRIEELAITNFRTFRERTVIPFRGDASEADAIATFHGDNGSGKSNAIAALSDFFDAALLCLQSEEGEFLMDWDSSVMRGGVSFHLSYRDRPAGADGATDVEVRFVDPRLGCLRIRFIPSGEQARIRLERLARVAAAPLKEDGEPAHSERFQGIANNDRDLFLTWLRTPFGPGGYPVAILDARRRASWLEGYAGQTSLLPAALANELFEHRTAFRPELRESWRMFTKVLERFATLRGKEVSIERIAEREPPVLILEERGRSVLRLEELSSGEQQLLVLCAAVVLANAGILVIEEPELSLDHRNQMLLQEILQEQVDAGRLDQVILESHVAAFDGPSVIRFRRGPAGNTEVGREPSAGEAQREIASKAKAHGAKQRWVTREGYTQLPENMREDLRLDTGGHVWFLKNQSRWEAWPEDELAKFLSDDEPEKRVLSCE